MKLRSGKVLPTRIDRLPEDLDNLLETRLQEFKKMFSDNPQHAKELLKTISKAKNGDARVYISSKVEEAYDPNLIETHSLLRTAGELLRCLIYNPEYHDLIEDRIKNYDLELSLLGNVEDNNSMELL